MLEASLQLPESKIEASRHDLRDDTVKYIRWEMVAAVIQGLERFTHVIFVLLKRDKVILLMTLLQALLQHLYPGLSWHVCCGRHQKYSPKMSQDVPSGERS